MTALWHAYAQQLKVLFRTSDKGIVRCICECTYNVLHGNVKLKKPEKKRLRGHKRILSKLASDKSRGWQVRKRDIVQGGGAFLPLLLASIVGALVSKIFGSNEASS